MRLQLKLASAGSKKTSAIEAGIATSARVGEFINDHLTGRSVQLRPGKNGSDESEVAVFKRRASARGAILAGG